MHRVRQAASPTGSAKTLRLRRLPFGLLVQMREQIAGDRGLLILVLHLGQRRHQRADVCHHGYVLGRVVKRGELRQAGMQAVLIALGVADHVQSPLRQRQAGAHLGVVGVGVRRIAPRC